MRGVRRQRQRRQQRLALAIPQRLRRRTPCAIAIACNAFWTRVRIRTQFKKLERTGLTRFFSVILTSGEYGIAKPDPRIFQEACRRAAVAATDAVYVGDDWSLDIVGSLGSGPSADLGAARRNRTSQHSGADSCGHGSVRAPGDSGLIARHLVRQEPPNNERWSSRLA